MTTVQALPARCAITSTTARSLGEVSYSNTWRSSQPFRAGRGVTSFRGRFASGLYAAQAAATAAAASAACESTMAMCVSVSGGSRITRFLPVAIDHPVGTVKVAPAGVTRGVSAANRSGADLVSAWVDAEDVGPAAAPNARVASVKANRTNRAVRRIDMWVTKVSQEHGKLRSNDTPSTIGL